jgi:hypothetical protein
MLGSAFASFLVSAAMSFVDWYLARKAIRDDERNEIRGWMQANIDRANAYKDSHPIVLGDDPFGDFVQSDKPAADSQVEDPGSTGATGRNPDGSS